MKVIPAYLAMTSYAQKAGGGKAKKRKKLNVLDIMLERRNKEVNYTLNKEELAKLLFKKMMIQPADVVKTDTSAFGKIHVELKDNVKPEKFVELPVFDIREGLRTKFYRPHHRQDTLVKISWLDLETSDDLIIHILSFFGTLKSGIQYCTMKEEEGESELAKLLNKIPNGERQAWMEIETPLPSYAVIDGRRVKIWHPGQRRTCARCNQDVDHCVGGANARHCEEKGGNKTKTDDMWSKVLESVKYTEWNGDEIKDLVEETVDTGEDTPKDEIEKWDGVVLSNINENATENDIKMLLKLGLDDQDIEGVDIKETGNKRSRIVTGIAKEKIAHLSKKLEKKVVDGTMVHCKPHVPSTPPKPNESIPAAENDAANVDNPVPNDAKIDNPGPNVTSPKQVIPGLSEDERLKHLKETKKPNKSKPKKKGDKKKEPKEMKITKLSLNDFLKIPAQKIDQSTENFVFSDKDDAFEDSKDVFSDDGDDESMDNFLTPLNFKSAFGLRLSASTPDLTLKAKRPAESPAEKDERKKSKSSSSSNITQK